MKELSEDKLSEQYADSKNLCARMDLHARFSTNKQGWKNWLFEQMDLQEAESILELGAGPGRLWEGKLENLPTDCSLVVSDISSGMVDEARKVLKDPRISFKIINAEEIDYPDNTFDRVIANHMLYHVPDLEQGLAEIRRVLRPKGIFYAATNGQEHLRELHNIIRKTVPGFQGLRSSFYLENGQGFLEQYFDDVQMYRYEDSLEVTNADPLLTYVHSLAGLHDLSDKQLDEIGENIRSEISQNGNIRIFKDPGLFISK